MSYGQPPPRTPYGDQDFVKEDWTPQPSSASSTPSVYGARHLDGPQNVPYSTLAPPQTSPVQTLQQGPYGGQPTQTNQSDVTNIVKSLTPEDQLFIRAWRRDSFYYRVLPLTALGGGAVFMYNQTRNLPHKPMRYLLVTMGAYAIGKWSYKGELKNRLAASPSNTPFIKALRDMLGVKPHMYDCGSEFGSDTIQDYSGFNSSNDPMGQQVNTAGYTGPGTSFNNYQANPNYLPSESDLSLSPSNVGSKSTTSYEELRARNRNLK